MVLQLFQLFLLLLLPLPPPASCSPSPLHTTLTSYPPYSPPPFPPSPWPHPPKPTSVVIPPHPQPLKLTFLNTHSTPYLHVNGTSATALLTLGVHGEVYGFSVTYDHGRSGDYEVRYEHVKGRGAPDNGRGDGFCIIAAAIVGGGIVGATCWGAEDDEEVREGREAFWRPPKRSITKTRFYRRRDGRAGVKVAGGRRG